LVFCGHDALSQQDPAEGQDIATQLAKITGNDPIQRALATQNALASNSSILRSMALEEALASSDQEVRELGLTYLATTQKQFVATISSPPQPQTSGDDSVVDAFLRMSPFALEITSVDQKTLNFQYSWDGHFGQGGGGIGSISRDGMTFYIPNSRVPVSNFYSPCTFTFRGIANGLLTGELSCGTYLFPATTPLP
jgi:hypothetical protein